MDASLSAPHRRSAFAPPRPRSAARGTLALALVMTLAAVLIRAPHFGDPAYHVDENFYRLVGQAMLGGELPYVDIWDRKPIGLFVLYALIGLLGGGGTQEYQLVAGLFAAATAFLIALIARRQTSDLAAALAGIAYLAAIEQLAGGGGQAAVFYNLFIVGAAMLTLRASECPAGPGFYGRAIAAMLLAGLAITLKQVAAIEGCFFGLALLWMIWRQTRAPAAVATWATIFMLCGLAPTAAGAVVYVLLGHWDAYWFATVTSILLKPPLAPAIVLDKLGYLLACLVPLIACAAIGLALRRWSGDDPRSRDTRFVAGWVVAAVLGLALIPNFYDHYALPLAAVLAIAAAPAFARGRQGLLLWLVPVAWSLATSNYPAAWGRSAILHDQAATVIRRHLAGGCLYIHDGPVHLYQATGACRVTRYLFPEHLNYALEAPAIGVDPAREIRHILARRPQVIVTAAAPVVAPNRETAGLLAQGLARDYRLVARAQVLTPVDRRTLLVWARRSQTNPPAN